MKTADGYIRVSRVAGRNGESFISPDEQRAAIEAWARSTKTTILEWHTDLDQSGGTLERPGFQIALERCRAGVTGGIVAAKLDRLTRSVVGLASLLDDAEERGYNLVALDLGLDLHSPNGELVANLVGSVAQWERKRRRDDWAVAQRNAIARGVPNGRAPVGYRKRPDRRLEIDETGAAKVRDAFRRRAAGEPFAAIGRGYGWSHSTTRQLLTNVVYLGVARSGPNVNEAAHPALVSEAEFRAANAVRTLSSTATGDLTRDRLLQGLARCAGCGRTLKVVHRKRADGSRVTAYYCKDAASEPCPERAYVHADDLDAYVAEFFAQALSRERHLIDVVAAGRDLEEGQLEHETARAELNAYVENASALDPALFQRGLDARQRRLDETQERVSGLAARVSRIPVGGSLPTLWERFSVNERRGVLAGFIGRVIVSRGASSDLAGHVAIEWLDGTVADDEEGVRVAAAGNRDKGGDPPFANGGRDSRRYVTPQAARPLVRKR
jgi:site-specific DNA recombinase